MRIKYRYDKFIVCPYAHENGCGHPRCYRLAGLECYMKGLYNHGTNKPKKFKHRHLTKHVR